MNFFQKDTKFVVGTCYEFIRVETNYRNPLHIQKPEESFNSWSKRSDEVGDVLPESPVYLGKYIKTVRMGSGDSGTRYDYFDKNGEQVANELLYDGTTRYRKVSCLEPTGGKRSSKRSSRRSSKRSSKRSSRRSSKRSSRRSSSSKRKTRKSRK